MVTTSYDKNKVELALLKEYGLRYSVLAAWENALREKGVMVPASVSKPLEKARVLISSGCFTACEVGADLTRIEAILISTATSAGNDPDNWVETLSECMSPEANIDAIEKKIGFSAVKSYFNRFDFSGECCGPA
ncbi:MAG: hypothetical protein IH611_08405 [Deltaproteobacteria bacterium]|nr:hypothetical protein [Deltaproteobacteria bacterium]